MVKELVILSGKGGTGKTSIAASFSCLAENKVIADCDVDAADLYLILKPETEYSGDYTGGKKAFIDSALCTECGRCIELCRFDAIDSHYKTDTLSCEGCGVCAAFCPANAIELKNHIAGRWFVSGTAYGNMVHARLGIAEGNSGKLVSSLRNMSKEKAQEGGCGLIISDGSPGIGCPVIASITGSYFILVVTEPTVSGIHDMKRIHALTKHFGIRTAVCVNRYDINPEKSHEIEEYCHDSGLLFFGVIPYDRDVTDAQIAGKSVVEYSTGAASRAIKDLWMNISNEIFK